MVANSSAADPVCSCRSILWQLLELAPILNTTGAHIDASLYFCGLDDRKSCAAQCLMFSFACRLV